MGAWLGALYISVFIIQWHLFQPFGFQPPSSHHLCESHLLFLRFLLLASEVLHNEQQPLSLSNSATRWTLAHVLSLPPSHPHTMLLFSCAVPGLRLRGQTHCWVICNLGVFQSITTEAIFIILSFGGPSVLQNSTSVCFHCSLSIAPFLLSSVLCLLHVSVLV